MNNMERAQRDWETPPDEPEARYCETCGKEMEFKKFLRRNEISGYVCTNLYCPDEFSQVDHYYEDGLVKGMAEHLAEVEQDLEDAKRRLHNAKMDVANLKDKLTLSQSKVVVRDTDYQVKRMEDAIEMAEVEEHVSLKDIRIEWNECKKIMENL